MPDEIALACFDDPRWGDVIDPPLTAVRIAPSHTLASARWNASVSELIAFLASARRT